MTPKKFVQKLYMYTFINKIPNPKNDTTRIKEKLAQKETDVHVRDESFDVYDSWDAILWDFRGK